MDPLTMRILNNHGDSQELRGVNNLSTIFEIGPRYVINFEIVRLFDREEGTSTNINKQQQMFADVFRPKILVRNI